MRTINLKGHEYQIHASITVDSNAEKRRNEVLKKAEAEAIAEADEKEIADASALIREKMLAAIRDRDFNLNEALNLIADMINAAVEYNRIILCYNTEDKVYGGYPMTAEKLVFLCSVEDLNSKEVSEAVAAELIEARGGTAAKKLTAQEVLKLTETIFQQ